MDEDSLKYITFKTRAVVSVTMMINVQGEIEIDAEADDTEIEREIEAYCREAAADYVADLDSNHSLWSQFPYPGFSYEGLRGLTQLSYEEEHS